MRLWIQVCGGPMGKGYRGVPSLPVQSWLDKREGLGMLERHCLGGGQKLAGRSQGWGVKGLLIPLEPPTGGVGLWPHSVASMARVFQAPRFHPCLRP